MLALTTMPPEICPPLRNHIWLPGSSSAELQKVLVGCFLHAYIAQTAPAGHGLLRGKAWLGASPSLHYCSSRRKDRRTNHSFSLNPSPTQENLQVRESMLLLFLISFHRKKTEPNSSTASFSVIHPETVDLSGSSCDLI